MQDYVNLGYLDYNKIYPMPHGDLLDEAISMLWSVEKSILFEHEQHRKSELCGESLVLDAIRDRLFEVKDYLRVVAKTLHEARVNPALSKPDTAP